MHFMKEQNLAKRVQKKKKKADCNDVMYNGLHKSTASFMIKIIKKSGKIKILSSTLTACWKHTVNKRQFKRLPKCNQMHLSIGRLLDF